MQRLKNIQELTFSKGMDTKHKPEYVKPGYCVLAQNCLVTEEKLVKGPGHSTFFNIGNNKKILGMYSSGSRLYVTVNEPGGSLSYVYSTTSSATPVVVSGSDSAADTNMEFVDCGTAIYALNGVNAVGKIVTITWTEPAGIPIGKYGVWVNNRFYIAGNSSNPNRLYFSNLNTPDTFGASDYIDIKPEENDQINGLEVLGGVLIVGKRNRVLTFDGFTVDDFTVKAVGEEFPAYGVTSQRSMVNVGDDVWFMSVAGGVPHIRSIKRTSFDKLNYGGIVSDIIQGTMETINTDQLAKVAAGFDGRYVWFSVPVGTSIENNAVICKDTTQRDEDSGWTYHTDINASVWVRSRITGNDRLYFGSNESLSKVYELNESVLSKDGTSIDWVFISRKYKPALNRKVKWKYIYWTLGADSSASIDVYVSVDGYSYELVDTLSSSASDSVFPITFPFTFGEATETKPPRTNLGLEPAFSLQIKLMEESSGSMNSFPMTFPISFGDDRNVEVTDIEVMYYPKGLRD